MKKILLTLAIAVVLSIAGAGQAAADWCLQGPFGYAYGCVQGPDWGWNNGWNDGWNDGWHGHGHGHGDD
jgi:opacity protein-like surface antigen